MQVLAVPVKPLDRAKRRLSPVLSADERARLTLAMLRDVLDAATAMPGWEVWVVSARGSVLALAAGSGARPVEDQAGSLRGALRDVERAVAGMAPDPVLAVVLADLPRITAPALAAALDRGGPVVAAPAGSDEGTNVLVRRPPSVIPNRFGPSSFHRHRDEAYRAGVTFRQVDVPELAFDLDTPADLARLLAGPRAGRAFALCAELGVSERLAARAAG
jgi:2-phospho-L-lactate guanylyltransferase